jgi:hypothetical protein
MTIFQEQKYEFMMFDYNMINTNSTYEYKCYFQAHK